MNFVNRQGIVISRKSGSLSISKTPRDESLGALHFTGNLPESDSGKIRKWSES